MGLLDTALGAVGTAFGGPMGGAIATGLGGLLGGASSPNASSQQQAAKPVPKYTGAFGSATETGFDYVSPVAQQTGMARSQLGNMLQGGMTYDPAMAGQYQQAYLNARTPAMEQQLAQQANTQAAGLSATGMAGSSGAMYQDALRNQMANQQRNELQNNAVLGGQQLAQQDLQNKLSSAGFLQNMSQQDIANALGAQQLTASNRLQSQEGNVGLMNQGNQAGLLNAQQQNTLDQNRLQNIFGGAQAGYKLYNGVYGTPTPQADGNAFASQQGGPAYQPTSGIGGAFGPAPVSQYNTVPMQY